MGAALARPDDGGEHPARQRAGPCAVSPARLRAVANTAGRPRATPERRAVKRRPLIRALLVAIAISSGLTVTSPATTPAAAQDAPGLELRLVSQPMTVAPNGDLVVVLAVDGQLPADAE